jgi:hypothetical protein
MLARKFESQRCCPGQQKGRGEQSFDRMLLGPTLPGTFSTISVETGHRIGLVFTPLAQRVPSLGRINVAESETADGLQLLGSRAQARIVQQVETGRAEVDQLPNPVTAATPAPRRTIR